jgi:molecular chaperone GrpE
MSEENKTETEKAKVNQVEVEYINEDNNSQKQKKTKKDQDRSLKSKLKKKETEINRLNEKIDELKDEYLRQAAEKENLRKRLEREKDDYYQFALSDFLKELLSVLDNFERALESNDQVEEASFRQGVEMIYKQMKDLLYKQGVAPITVEGKKFDPHRQQAFLTEESEEVDEPQVSEELQRGYTLHNRLLRPTLVKVLVPKKEE